MKAVDIFARIDRADDFLFVDVFRWWRLHEDTVDRGVGIEIAHDLQQFVLRGARGQLDLARKNSELAAGADFRSDIHMRGRIIADQHDREAGRGAAGFEGFDFRAALIEHGGGHGFSIKQSGLIHRVG